VRVEASIDIARSPEEVWAVVADPEQDVRWCPKVRGVTPAGSHRWQVTHAPVPLRPAKTLVLQQVLTEAPRRLVLRQEDDVSVFDVEYTLAPVSDGATRFTQRSDFAWKTLPRVLHRIFAKGVERDVSRQLAKLKALLEDGNPE
jgi:uncharacterized protein YndB with AHSA1/START domain